MRRFKSDIFEVQEVSMGDKSERIVLGGRDKFPLLSDAFQGINQIGVIGWGSQGPAQAQNLRESLQGLSTRVVVGLRKDSESIPAAEAAGFTRESGTLGEMFAVIGSSDLVVLLISDAAQVEHYKEIMDAMKPGAILGLSHGFLLGHLDTLQFGRFPDLINVIGVYPKGMGPSVRRLYEQGRDVNGAGINCSFSVDDYDNQRVVDVALGWAIAIGAPYVFQTSMRNEYKSDIFGERGILLGYYGMLEAYFKYLVMCQMYSPYEAYRNTVENVTGIISATISKHGIIGLYERCARKDIFEQAYSAAYGPYFRLLHEIYQEVESGNEITSVVLAGKRLEKYPMEPIDRGFVWKAGEGVRASRAHHKAVAINPVMAGFYAAAMIAQCDVLIRYEHELTEVCNESVIESVDSLNPYMHFKGVAHMVDNCSTTARLGTRKWGPRWDYATTQQAIPNLEMGLIDEVLIDAFKNHKIHRALEVCASMRPPVDISVQQ